MLKTVAHLKAVPKLANLDILYGHLVTADPVELLETQRLQKLYGNLYDCSNILSPNFYTACGAPEIAHIHKNHKNYVKKYKINKVFGQTFGQGILNCSGSKYEDRRKNMLQVFKMDNLKEYLGVMQKSIDIFVERIRQDILRQEQDKNKPIIDIDRYSTLICLDIAAKTFFNREWGEDLEQVSVIVNDLNQACRNSSVFSIKKHIRINQILFYLKQIIKKRFINSRQYSDSGVLDLLHYLDNYTGEQQYKYNDVDLLDEVTTLLITGHETSATAIVFAMALLQLDPNYKNLVLDEVRNLPADISYKDLQSCIYIRMLIDETLRMYPPVWFTMRYCLEQDEINGFYIPGKSYIFSNFYVLHRNQEYWVKPNVFDPFRFAPENKDKIVPYSYLPFIMGARTCLASNFATMEVQLVLIKLLQNFDFNVIPGTKMNLLPHITLRTTENLCLYANSL
jgi:cytochrome P450